MSMKYSLNKELTVVQETFHVQRKQVLQSILTNMPSRFPISELYTKLGIGFFEYTALTHGYLFVYYDSLAKSMKTPIAATIYLLPHIDGN